jgi:dolichol-phosphate mannosyltransferase
VFVKSISGFSVVVPVHNEEENIESLIAEIHAALDAMPEFEVLYVDDGSSDATAFRLTAAKTKYPRLRAVRHLNRCGQSAALASGVRVARYPWIVTLDGDGQNDPRDIPGLLARASEREHPHSPRLIAGVRLRREDNWLRRASSRIANAVRGRLLHDQTTDTGCGLKAFRRLDFLALPYFDHMHRFLPALFLRGGGEVISVFVHHRPRSRGRSKYGVRNRLWAGIVDLLGVMWLQRRMTLPIIVEEYSNES